MLLPSSVSKKRDSIISVALKELSLDPTPIATEPVTDEFNTLRSDILKLHDVQDRLIFLSLRYLVKIHCQKYIVKIYSHPPCNKKD